MESTNIKETKISPYVLFNNWLKDGNLKSPYPKDLENDKYAISPLVILNHFLNSPKYFIFINNLFNTMDLFKIKVKEIALTLKEAYYYCGYSSYGTKKRATAKPNELINILYKKYPYYKKDEICMVVDFIDKSEDKDNIYEMFGLKGNLKTKKLTKIEKQERTNKISSIVSSNEIMNLM